MSSALGWRRSGDHGAAAEESIIERAATHRSRDWGSNLPGMAALRDSSLSQAGRSPPDLKE